MFPCKVPPFLNRPTLFSRLFLPLAFYNAQPFQRRRDTTGKMAGERGAAEPVIISGGGSKSKIIKLHFKVNKLKFYSDLAFPMMIVVQRNPGHREDEECLCHRGWDEAQHFFRVKVGLNVLCLCKMRGASYFGCTNDERRYFPVVLCIKSGAANAVNWDIAEWNSTDFYTDIYMSQLLVPTDPPYCSTVYLFRAMPSPDSLRALSLKTVSLSNMTFPMATEVFQQLGVIYPFCPSDLLIPAQTLLLSCHHVRASEHIPEWVQDGDLNAGDLCGLLFGGTGHYTFLTSSSAVLHMPYLRNSLCMRHASLLLRHPSYASFLDKFPLF